MSKSIEYRINTASPADIAEHLLCCDVEFIPRLSSRVDINDYAKKIASRAMRFEAWLDDSLIGLVAAYCNDQEKRIAYITSVSVLKDYTGKGIAAKLIKQCIEHAQDTEMRQISLEVARDNVLAINLYEKNGFVADKAHVPYVTMDLYLGREGAA